MKVLRICLNLYVTRYVIQTSVQFKWNLPSLSRDYYTWNWHDLHVIYVQNIQKLYVFNSTVQTSIENWIKNEWILEKDYTNILKKLQDDLSSNFEDIALKNMTFLALLPHIEWANDRVLCIISQRAQI